MKVTRVKWKKRGNHCDNKGEIKRKCPYATHTSGLSPSRAYSPMCNACRIRDYVHHIFNIYMANIIIAISYSHDSAITEVQLLLSCITCFHSAGAERFIFGALLSVCSSTLMCYLKICISWFLDVHQPVHDNLVHRRPSSLPNTSLRLYFHPGSCPSFLCPQWLQLNGILTAVTTWKVNNMQPRTYLYPRTGISIHIYMHTVIE